MYQNVTPRREKRHVKENQKLETMRMYRELQRLWKEKWNTPLIKLDKPIRSGWEKTYVLRDDIARREDAQIFRDILAEINSTLYCGRKDFLGKDYKTKKMKPLFHPRYSIGKKRWEELEVLWTPAHKRWIGQHGWWTDINEKCQWHGRYGTCDCRYSKVPAFYWDVKIKAHYITHVREVDALRESRTQEIENHFRKHALWPKIDHYLGLRNRRYNDDWYDSIPAGLAEAAKMKEWQDSGFEEPYNDPYYEFKQTDP